jgi:hypothetical protein
LARLELVSLPVPDCPRAYVAESWRARALGLAWLAAEPAGDCALLLPRCRSIHSFGMRFELDVWFLDADWRPLRHLAALPPRRVAGYRAAAAVLERPAAAPMAPRPLSAASRA